MDRRMAALFLVALGLIFWQALRTRPALQPAFEIATRAGEQLTPLAVPAWRPPLSPPPELAARRAFLDERALAWPGVAVGDAESRDCQAYLHASSQHWVRRPLTPARRAPWQVLMLPAAAFLDDDDGDGDRLDAGELRTEGAGAEVEVFCPP